ncbi:AMP-binding protein [Streptomyces sp. HSG2]|uniref:AMP-binding protein n=1 Tax=Streptomyces sp. HSG2 TaxID=2797167 RepID=UPI00190309EE|nr:AMP-binding protein [Streptomyces sp. HSG2]
MILPNVLDPFFAIANSDPHRPAVVDDGVTVGYGRLARWAGAVADLVATRDPASAPPVAVHTHHSVRDIAAILGTLAAGRCFVPIATDGQPDHIDRALRVLGCRELVATADIDGLPNVDRVLRPNWSHSSAPLRETGEAVPARAPAYVMFTSGSTGAPKAAAVPHGALHAVLPHLIREFGIDSDTVALNYHRADGDTSLEELLPTLLAGGLVVLDDDSEADLDRVLTDYEVSLVNLPVDHWHLYTGHLLDTGRTVPKSVRTVVVGGEAVRPDMLSRWARVDSGRAVLLNTYGCTETALITHTAVLAGPGAPEGFPDGVPIGRPLPSVRQAVAPRPDAPDGCGELLVSGAQLAIGYVGDPERTSARFVESDAGDGAARWYHTGDLVSEDAEGTLLFRGRVDHQVQIRGHNVDLVDVESAVGRLPGVTAVAAAAHTKGEHTVLVAFVVLSSEGFAPEDTSGVPGSEGATHALRERLRATLPEPLVPARVVAVPELVHTRTGKIDRARTRDRYL